MLSAGKNFLNLTAKAMFNGVRLAAAVAGVALLLGAAAPASAGYDEGAAAFIRGDYEMAWKEWLALGERGHQSAQYNLGVLYSIGLGVEQNDVEAAKWFKMAAERGLPAAQMRLGTAYLEGKGVAEDPKEAYFWFTLAATHFSLGEQHDQAVAAREKTGAELSRAQITEVLEKAMNWKPLPQTMDESEKQQLVAEPNSENTLTANGGAQDGLTSQQVDAAVTQAKTPDVARGATSQASAASGQDEGQEALPAQAAEMAEAPAAPSETGAQSAGAQEPAGEQSSGDMNAASASPPAQSAEPAEQPMDATGSGASDGAETPAKGAATEMAAATATGGSDAQAPAKTPDLAPRVFFAAHLSSVRSEAGTKDEWRNLQEHFPQLLADKTLTVRTIDITDKGIFYRVMAGTFATFDEAQAFCDQFQASKQYCVVRRLKGDSPQ